MRFAALAVLLASACLPEHEDALVRAVRHAREKGDALGGDPVKAGAIARQLGMQAARNKATLVISDLPPATGSWEPIWTGSEHGLYRRAEPVDAGRVSVKMEDLPGRVGSAPKHAPVLGWVQHGPASPGGELVVTAFVHPPARMIRTPCLSLHLDGREIPLGTLLQGRGGFVPGAGPRPVVRHRARIGLPQGLTLGRQRGEVALHHCEVASLEYAPRTPVSLEISASGRPSREDLDARVGELDPKAEWAQPRGRRYALRRKADGSIEQVPAPPLPRVERGAAFGLLVTPPLTLGPWGEPDGTVGPLTPLGPLFEEADATLVHLQSSASMHGRSPDDRPVSRVRPHVLQHLAELDVQGVILGASPRAVRGDRTAENAALLGLRSGVVNVGDNENAVGVSVHVFEAGHLWLPSDLDRRGLVLGVVDAGGSDPVEAARALAESGVDGGWVLADTLGPVVMHGGVPIVAGIPPMKPVGTSVAMRWYVSPSGVQRVDLVGLEGSNGRWQRVRDGRLKADFQRVSALSAREGVRMAAGEQVAAVSIWDHGPDRDRSPAPTPASTLDLPELQAVGLPAASRPPQCAPESTLGVLFPDGRPAPREISVSEDLILRDALLFDAKAGPGNPVRVELVWEARRPLPPGRLQWYVEGLPGTWRASTAPCEGLWSFEDFVPGEIVRETVRLFPPDGLPGGSGSLQLGLRLGEERPNLGTGRFLELGEVTVEGPAPSTPPARPPSPDVPIPPTP